MSQQSAAAYRLPKELLDHLTHAANVSELKKTVIVRRALEEFLNKNYPLPE